MYMLYFGKQEKNCLSHVKSIVTFSNVHFILHCLIYYMLIFVSVWMVRVTLAGTCLYGSPAHVTKM